MGWRAWSVVALVVAASCSADDDGYVDGAVATTGGTAPGATTSPVDTAAPVTSEPSAAAVGADIIAAFVMLEGVRHWAAYVKAGEGDLQARIDQLGDPMEAVSVLGAAPE